MLETSSYHLVREDEQKYLTDRILLANSKTEYKYLRTSLLAPFLRTFAANKDAEYPQKIFELGSIFSLNKTNESGVLEKGNLAIALSPGNATSIKQVFDYLSRMLNFSCTIKEKSLAGFIEGRAFALCINKQEIGYLGELHPDTLSKWNIKMPVAFLECSVDSLHPK